MKLSVCSVIIHIVSFALITNAANINDITRLRAQILQNYDRHVRPVQKNEDTTNLQIHFLNNGIEFDDKRGVMTLHLFTPMTWEDQHIKWDPLNYGNLTEITFSPDELWRPDMSLINNYDTSEIDHFSNTLMIATAESEIWWIPPTKFQASCPTDFYLWPYDTQRCRFQVSSWSYDGNELNITVPENYTKLVIEDDWQEHNIENREWKLTGSLVERDSQVLYCCPEVRYIDILISVAMERRSSSHTAAVTAVGIGIASAILISFWLSPFAEERIPLTLVIMLLNALYLQFMYNTVPKNGTSVPLAICFFRDSLIMVTFAFAWTVGIRYMAKTKRKTPVPLPDFVQTLLNSFVATILCLNPRPIDPKAQAQASSSGEDGDVSELVREDNVDYVQQDWEWLARLMDRIAFFGYLISYVIFIASFL